MLAKTTRLTLGRPLVTIKGLNPKQLQKKLSEIPKTPGIYKFFDESGVIIYVGKAKNLRRRLSQYAHTKRVKRHRKMKAILASSARFIWENCSSELEALTLENQLIQTLRPKWNTAGAFYFLYPLVGVQLTQQKLIICYSTKPELYPELSWNGAYRTRGLTRDAFFGLCDLLKFVAHLDKRGFKKRDPYTIISEFRNVPECFSNGLSALLRGESSDLLGEVSLLLLENAGARRDREEIQEILIRIRRFFRFEAKALYNAKKHLNLDGWPIPQTERDLLFIKRKFTQKNFEISAPPR